MTGSFRSGNSARAGSIIMVTAMDLLPIPIGTVAEELF